MEQQVYHLTLLLSGITCIVMAAALSYNNFYYRDYRIYKRSRLLTALTLTTFGIGFLLHLYFGWRTCWPSAATALSVTYFHIGGTMLSWSHTSLLNPEYLNRFRVIRDMTALVVNTDTSVWRSALQVTEDEALATAQDGTILNASAQCEVQLAVL